MSTKEYVGGVCTTKMIFMGPGFIKTPSFLAGEDRKAANHGLYHPMNLLGQPSRCKSWTDFRGAWVFFGVGFSVARACLNKFLVP